MRGYENIHQENFLEESPRLFAIIKCYNEKVVLFLLIISDLITTWNIWSHLEQKIVAF